MDNLVAIVFVEREIVAPDGHQHPLAVVQLVLPINVQGVPHRAVHELKDPAQLRQSRQADGVRLWVLLVGHRNCVQLLIAGDTVQDPLRANELVQVLGQRVTHCPLHHVDARLDDDTCGAVCIFLVSMRIRCISYVSVRIAMYHNVSLSPLVRAFLRAR